MDLKDLRKQIDVIDDQIAKLYAERMEVSKNVAITKKENNIHSKAILISFPD